MNETEIQAAVNDLAARMIAKGMREPDATLNVKANVEPTVWFTWKHGAKSHNGYSDNKYHIVRGKNFVETIENARTWISAQPDKAETARRDFASAVADAIEVGKARGMEVDFLNPLLDTMKRLSENIIENHG